MNDYLKEIKDYNEIESEQSEKSAITNTKK